MATVPTTHTFDGRPLRVPRHDRIQELLNLQKAAQRINSALDLDQLIERVVEEVASSLHCVETNVYLCEEDCQEVVLAGVRGCTVHGKGHRLKIGKDGMVGYVAATRQMRYAPDVANDPYYMMCEAGTRSEVAIPLQHEGALLGVFTVSSEDLNGFSPEQLRLLQNLGDHIAVAVHNARRFQDERQQRERMSLEASEAQIIQQSLFPKSSPYVPGFAISGLSLPAGAVGGDWYDFLCLGKDLVGLVLADVSGKGMAAALLMSATRGMLRSLAEACQCPGDVLTRLNRLLVNDFPLGRYVTMIYGVLDPRTRTLALANAGHLRPLLVVGDQARFLETNSGLPLGLPSDGYSRHMIDLPAGARLVLYSDGITEAENGREAEYGEERLLQHMLRPDATAQTLLADVKEFAGNRPLRDDATVIFVQA
jgi:sigma-B regulation protein RsbU (phosphoserine phosphatase)